jgi:hypothetical protein
MKQIITKKDVKDKKGWTIPKGTRLFVETTLKNPMSGKEELIVYVDNGTADFRLMPKTLLEKEALK